MYFQIFLFNISRGLIFCVVDPSAGSPGAIPGAPDEPIEHQRAYHKVSPAAALESAAHGTLMLGG